MENMHFKLWHEDQEDALSLSDLPLYSDVDDQLWEQDFSTESQAGSSSISSYQDESCFEFFSQEFNPPAAGFPPENIMFCGKLIPYKQPLDQDSSKRSSKDDDQYFPRLLSHNRSHKTYLKNRTGEKGCDSPASKMSILAPSSSGKARWYLFLFGMSRFSNEVKLGDIKSRQSRRQCPSPPPLHRSGGNGGGRGLWWLVKALSCGSHSQTTAMVAASISRIPAK